jgi:hypothetical protein
VLEWMRKRPRAGHGPPEDAPTRPTGHLDTASRLHAFNRYEIKYFVDELRVPELRAELAARM